MAAMQQKSLPEHGAPDPMDVFRSLLDALPFLAIHVESDQRYGYANRAYRESFGVTNEDLRGRHVTDVIEPDLYERLAPYRERALEGETVQWEVDRLLEDDTTGYFRGSFVPYVTPAGEQNGYLVLVEDVTERVRLQRQLEETMTRVVSGFIPICASCKDVRDGDQWKTMEAYVGQKSGALFSHGLCPECVPLFADD